MFKKLLKKFNVWRYSNPWGIPPKQLEAELRAEMAELREERLQADKDAASLFGRGLDSNDY